MVPLLVLAATATVLAANPLNTTAADLAAAADLLPLNTTTAPPPAPVTTTYHQAPSTPGGLADFAADPLTTTHPPAPVITYHHQAPSTSPLPPAPATTTTYHQAPNTTVTDTPTITYPPPQLPVILDCPPVVIDQDARMTCQGMIHDAPQMVWTRIRQGGKRTNKYLKCDRHTCDRQNKHTVAGTVTANSTWMQANLTIANYGLRRDGELYKCSVAGSTATCKQRVYQLPPAEKMVCNMNATTIIDNIVRVSVACNSWKVYPKVRATLMQSVNGSGLTPRTTDSFTCDEFYDSWFDTYHQACALLFHLTVQGTYTFKVLVRPIWDDGGNDVHPEINRMIRLPSTITVEPPTVPTIDRILFKTHDLLTRTLAMKNERDEYKTALARVARCSRRHDVETLQTGLQTIINEHFNETDQTLKAMVAAHREYKDQLEKLTVLLKKTRNAWIGAYDTILICLQCATLVSVVLIFISMQIISRKKKAAAWRGGDEPVLRPMFKPTDI